MLRFESFEAFGPALAVISDQTDGDCADPAVRERFLRELGVDPGALHLLRQVHGDTVVEVNGPGGVDGARRSGDALFTRTPGVPLGISVADCVPVFLFGAKPATIALVHAGREGTRRAIVSAAVRRMTAGNGTTPEGIRALIGPSAGPCCYEVSAELAADWTAAGLPARGRHLDLWEANRRHLAACGVPPEQTVVLGHCTICAGRFHSYRAGSATARNLAVLML
jgi:YfiH family protein